VSYRTLTVKKFALGVSLLLLGFLLAGCGSSQPVVTFRAPTTIRLASADTGARIACRRGPGPTPAVPVVPNGRLIVGTVPAPGKQFAGINGLDGMGIQLSLARGADGSLLIKCG
jgi:hypothetical protein